MMITAIDTETTGLLEAEGADISLQPYIIELCAIQFSDDFEIVNEIDTFVKPPRPVTPMITKITGITNNHVANAPIFAEIVRPLISVFFGSHTMVAHNLTFDLMMVVNELRRLGKEFQFPYPPVQFCTVEQSMHIKGHRLKNGELYELATGKTIDGAHRARVDVLATIENYKWLKGI